MRRALLAALAISGLLGGPARAESRLDLLLEEAVRAKQAGDLERSLALMEEAYEERPLPEILNNMGRLLSDLGRYDQAVDAYRRVVNAPKVDPKLVRLDTARIRELEPKLESAHLALELDRAGVSVWIDGKEALDFEGRELAVSAGRHVLEVATHDRTVIALERLDLVRGRRTSISVALDRGPSEGHAVLDLEGTVAEVERLSVDGYSVQGVGGQTRVSLAAGPHTIEALLAGRRAQALDLFFEGGSVVLLAEHMERPEAIPAPRRSIEVDRAALSRDAPGASAWPAVLSGVGAVGAAVGTVLIWSAERDRARVRNAARTGELITGVTFADAVAIEDGANTKATLGVSALAAGGSVLLTGLAWWLIDLASGG